MFPTAERVFRSGERVFRSGERTLPAAEDHYCSLYTSHASDGESSECWNGHETTQNIIYI